MGTSLIAPHPVATAAPPPGVRPTLRRHRALRIAVALNVLLSLWIQAVAMRIPGFVGVDFGMFWDSSRAFREGRTPYFLTNLNHPFAVVAMSPLTLLSPRTAYLVWVAITLATLPPTFAIIVRELALPPGRQWLLAIAPALAGPGLVSTLWLGQLALPLALLATLAWRSLRRGRWLTAGALLGLLVALKPFLAPLLAIFLVRRSWRGLLGSALGAGGISLAALPFVGVAGFVGYVRILLAATDLAHIHNLSLTGLLYWQAGVERASLWRWPLIALICLAASLLLLRPSWRGLPRIDRDFGLLIVAAILASPLGWPYYLLLLWPVLVALLLALQAAPALARRSALVALGLPCLPYVPLEPTMPRAWLLLTVALIALAIALAAQDTPPAAASRT